MLKIKEILKTLVDTQKEINKNLKELNEGIKLKSETISINADKITSISSSLTDLASNVYTKDETIKTINKECDYRREYEDCKEENPALLQIIEDYCKYDDKYQVLKIFNTINERYKVTRR